MRLCRFFPPLRYVPSHLHPSPQTVSVPPARSLPYKTLRRPSTMGELYLLRSQSVPSVPSTHKGLCRSPHKSPHPYQPWFSLTLALQHNYIHAHTDLAWYLVFIEWNLLTLPYEEMHFCKVEELPPKPDREEVATGLLEDPLRASTPMDVDNSTYRTASQPLLPLSLPVTSRSAAKPSGCPPSTQPPPSSLPASKCPTMVSHISLLSGATYPPPFSVKWQKERSVASTLVRRTTSKNGTRPASTAHRSRSPVSCIRTTTIVTAQEMYNARSVWSGEKPFSSAPQVARSTTMKETFPMELFLLLPSSRSDRVLTP